MVASFSGHKTPKALYVLEEIIKIEKLLQHDGRMFLFKLKTATLNHNMQIVEL